MGKNEKERRKTEKDLRKVGNKFLQILKEEVDSAVILCDVGRLERLTSIVHVHMDSEIIRALREKGFDKEIRELCDRAGMKMNKSKFQKGVLPKNKRTG